MRALKLIPISNLYYRYEYNRELVLSFLERLKAEVEVSDVQDSSKEIQFMTKKMKAKIFLSNLSACRVTINGLRDFCDLTKQSEMDRFIELLKTYEKEWADLKISI